MEESKVEIPTEEQLKKTYSKTYFMQAVGPDENTIRTSVPKQVVEREAKQLGLTVEEFLEKYKVQWLFNGFPGVYGMFVPIEKEKNAKG